MPCLWRVAGRGAQWGAGPVDSRHDELGGQHERLGRLVVVEQRPRRQAAAACPRPATSWRTIVRPRTAESTKSSIPMIDRSSGTRRPSRRARSRTPMAISSEAATIAVGRLVVGEQLGAVAGGGLRGPVGAEDPRVVALQAEVAHRLGNASSRSCGVWTWATFWGPLRCSRSSCGPGRRGRRRRCASRPCRRCARRHGPEPVNRWRRGGAPAGRRARSRRSSSAR